MQQLLDAGLVPLEDAAWAAARAAARDAAWAAAQALGMEPKRLRGFMWRNGIADPIGDQDRVYGWSCRALAAKLATASRETAHDE